MAQRVHLIVELKRVLKERGITYAGIAEHLRLSQASVKRLFSSQDFSLSRIDQICELAGIELTDLVARLREGRARDSDASAGRAGAGPTRTDVTRTGATRAARTVATRAGARVPTEFRSGAGDRTFDELCRVHGHARGSADAFP